ncbi:ankyrin repeat domain-containing protein [Wolbachia endosymbiont of Drosophila aff. chauvacae BK-2020]|uniref:ankyrin repeat domain-containing protein n=1 Tax=unclassified Wolbachia TaxID=2640676 RepID=UPI0023AA0AFA|nr:MULTISPECIES: ankyrin repeat domain-containing protein [unclassified Wolbachia]MDE5060479.1 ankyrin repeat domain-containing protein [Wolbachia endosymbiont of Drosophila burlai]MDU8909186.1 ankyrin repeat domain-containing protein [Wolbachia endosymbiont of Drosophila bocqueti]WOE62637.1 ankyrin repeat domain-containing protein [Wolbachia endosymbiont of Drosophila aff. chauvacae BK-2020]
MGSEFEEMLKEILQEINDQGFNKDNIIDKIKDKLQEEDPRVYNGWKDNKFDIDHLFLPGIMLRMIAKDTKLTGFFIEYERTLLYVAAEHGHIQIVENLLDNGAKTGIKNGYCKEAPLHVAAKHGHIRIVEILSKKEADIDLKNRYGETPLHYAAKYGHTQVLENLLGRSTNVNVQSEVGRTPLHDAANNGHIEVVKHLIKKGADVNVQSKVGRTP